MTCRFSLLSLVVLIVACQTPAAPASEPAPPAPAPERAIVGAYSPRATDDEQVVSAANEGVRLLNASNDAPAYELAQILQAESQVVAGMNFRLDLALRSDAGPSNKRLVVYRMLDGTYSLTSVEDIE